MTTTTTTDPRQVRLTRLLFIQSLGTQGDNIPLLTGEEANELRELQAASATPEQREFEGRF